MKAHVLCLMGILAISCYASAAEILFNNEQNNQGRVRIKGIIFGRTTGRRLRDLYTLQTGIPSDWPLYVSGLRLSDNDIISKDMQNLVFSFKRPGTVTTTF